jgi:hypothetical protein
MRPAVLCVLALTLCAGRLSANDGTAPTGHAASRAELAGLSAVTTTAEPASRGTLERLPDRLKERLETLAGRWRNDSRVQTATTVLGAGAAAIGAAHGRHAVALAGTQAMRWGLGRQLRAVEERSGFQIAPSVGRHHVVITARRVFR